jgi:hypothetical protein
MEEKEKGIERLSERSGRKRNPKVVKKRWKRKARRVTKKDRFLITEREKERRQERKDSGAKSKRREKFKKGKGKEWKTRVKRREQAEEKFGYERREARGIWKQARKARTGYRRKGKQRGRYTWMRKRTDEEKDGLRYYEKKPREYEEARKDEIERNPEKKKTKLRKQEKKRTERIQLPRKEERFWKTYQEEEGKQVREWKKGVIQKNAKGKDRLRPWDRWIDRENQSLYQDLKERRKRNQGKETRRDKETKDLERLSKKKRGKGRQTWTSLELPVEVLKESLEGHPIRYRDRQGRQNQEERKKGKSSRGSEDNPDRLDSQVRSVRREEEFSES